MKEKILLLIIGILIGAIMTTAGFLIYTKITNSNQPEMMQMNENRGQMDKAPSDNSNMEEPPEKPNGARNNQSSTRPESTNNNV